MSLRRQSAASLIVGVFLTIASAPVQATTDAPAPAATTDDNEGEPGEEVRPLSDAEIEAGVWEDHADARLMMARGTLAVCENVMLPVSFIPVAGQIAASVVEWFCVAPAILGVDYIETFHGRKQTQVWQSALALMAMKAIRDVVRLSSWIGVLVVAVVLLVAVAPALVFVPALGSLIYLAAAVSAGAAYVLLGLVRDAGSELAFEWIFDGLTDEHTEESRRKLREESIVQVPLDPPVRFFRNMAIVAGTDPAFDWWHLAPVYGAWVKAQQRAVALKRRVAAFARTETSTKNLDVTSTYAAIDAFAFVGGIAGGVGQATALAGLSLYAFDRNFFVFPDDNVDLIPTTPLGGVGVALLATAGAAFAVQVGARMVRMVWIPTQLAAASEKASGPAPQAPLNLDAE